MPYEGERPDEPSRTAGILPVQIGDDLARLHVEANRIVAVEGDGELVARLTMVFAADPARRNIAEVAFGCNDRAAVSGQRARGREGRLPLGLRPLGPPRRHGRRGGLRLPGTVVHQDIVYATGNPIQVAEATVLRDGQELPVMRGGEYVVF